MTSTVPIDIMKTGPNVCIMRNILSSTGSLIRKEMFGGWFVYEGGPWQMDKIEAEFAKVIAEEPDMGWKIFTKGTNSEWKERR